MATRTVRFWPDSRRALLIATFVFLGVALWGIMSSDKDHSMQHGMILGCMLLVVAVLIGDEIQRRKAAKM